MIVDILVRGKIVVFCCTFIYGNDLGEILNILIFAEFKAAYAEVLQREAEFEKLINS